MNSEIRKILYNRAKLIANLDKIVASSKRNNKGDGQLSLFGGSDDHVDVEISLDEPEDFNAILMAAAERDVLGFSMLYSQFDEYFPIQCRYCNANTSSFIDEDRNDNMTLLAEIKSIEHKTSQYGNKYA